MSQRYTDRDCYAALICLASAKRSLGVDVGVALPKAKRKADWRAVLAEFAAQLQVPIRDWRETTETAQSYGLDYSPMGGVRPAIYRKGSSGQWTPRWWNASAGLGPGATTKREFCSIVRAVADGLGEEP